MCIRDSTGAATSSAHGCHRSRDGRRSRTWADAGGWLRAHSLAAYPAMVNSNGSRPVDDPVSQRREILRLAVPAFLALVAEPLFLLADSAIIGHLGTTQLAGLGVASAALITAANIFVFLAYGTTSIVARQVGAGSERLAVGAGVDGLWLAITIGIVTVSYTHLTLPTIY